MTSLAEQTLRTVPQPLLGIGIFVLLLGAYMLGRVVRLRRGVNSEHDEVRQMFDGFIVSAVLGLLALLLGFTFSMAVERYDQRFELAVDEANAISSTYLLAQTFEDPHESRISDILRTYARNQLELAQSEKPDRTVALLAESESMQTCLWSASLTAVGNLRDDVSSSFLDNARQVIDISASRVAARLWHVPIRIHVVLLIYMLVSGFVLGFVFAGARQHMATAALFALLTLSMLLIIDLDRPTGGRIVEPQQPIEDLIKSLQRNPPVNYKTFDPPPATVANAAVASEPAGQSAERPRACHDAEDRKQPGQ
jgi:hypothetical protein